MLDQAFARLYEVETITLNRAVQYGNCYAAVGFKNYRMCHLIKF